MTTENQPEMTETESFFLSPMLSVTIRVTPTSMMCRWYPIQQPLTDAEAERFRKARDAMMEKQGRLRVANDERRT